MKIVIKKHTVHTNDKSPETWRATLELGTDFGDMEMEFAADDDPSPWAIARAVCERFEQPYPTGLLEFVRASDGLGRNFAASIDGEALRTQVIGRQPSLDEAISGALPHADV